MTIWLALATLSAEATIAEAARLSAQPVPLLPVRFELGAAPPSAVDLSLAAPADDGDSGNPLTVSAIDDGRHRLRLGVRPGGRARLGVAYRLSFGR